MDKFLKKEVEEGPSKDQQQEAEEKMFVCRLNSELYLVDCNTSMTVLDALNANDVFTTARKKSKNKEVLILRSEGVPRAAVKTDFPCCLIQNKEIIDVSFITNDESASAEKKTSEMKLPSNPDMFVTFYVKKRGGDKVKCLLKSKALRHRVEHVCVYAYKDDKLRTALERDGRFISNIYKKHCALTEFGTENRCVMSQPVKHLDQKIFRVVVLNDKQPESQEEVTSVKTEPVAASVTVTDDDDGSRQNPDNTQQTAEPKKEPVKSTGPSAKGSNIKAISNSEEILKILRDQFQGLLEKLKQRENLRKNPEVKHFFRAEYDKSVQSFSEVKKVRMLITLSDSVCQIRKEGFPLGTGFLLFNKFILTNAHVIGLFNLTDFNPAQFTAVFGYEDLDQTGIKRVPITSLTSYFYGKVEKGNHLDYALLELSSVDETVEYPELFSEYRQNLPDNRSQICIIGHPDGAKKMDPCFVIGKENRQEAENKHITENTDFYHVMSQQSLNEKWEFHDNQILYDSCFFHGSSGSPVFDADCKLIGIHTGGYVYKGEGGKTRSVMEYSYSLKPILDHIKAQAKIKGIDDIVNILEGNSNGSKESSGTEQQTDAEMESVED